MHVHLDLVNDAYHFQATNASGNTVSIDASPKIGGEGKGARPMEVVLMGLGGCSSIDVLAILRKQRQDVRRYEVHLDADRAHDQIPAVFTRIHVHFVLEGHLDARKVRRAIELSLGTYCSVTKMLEKTAPITYSFSINGEEHGPDA